MHHRNVMGSDMLAFSIRPHWTWARMTVTAHFSNEILLAITMPPSPGGCTLPGLWSTTRMLSQLLSRYCKGIQITQASLVSVLGESLFSYVPSNLMSIYSMAIFVKKKKKKNVPSPSSVSLDVFLLIVLFM